MSRVGIVSVIYLEPEWQQTKSAIESCNVPVHYVDRGGKGSLARAHNIGFKELTAQHELEYVWFLTNPVFDPNILNELVKAMDSTGYDAIHPAFQSDHVHCQPDGSGEIKLCKFVEFTAPIVKVSTYNKIKLDEKMPYWGHDYDWGYRVRQNGGSIAVHHGVTVNHVYIRYSVNSQPHPATTARLQLRRRADRPTHRRLEQLYGRQWKAILS